MLGLGGLGGDDKVLRYFEHSVGLSNQQAWAFVGQALLAAVAFVESSCAESLWR